MLKVQCLHHILGIVCWGGNISRFDTGRLTKLVRKASDVVGKLLGNSETCYEKRLYKTRVKFANYINPFCPEPA